jgi:uncharacterized protein (TIGR02246 family)
LRFLTIAVLRMAAEKGSLEDEVAIRQVIADWTGAFNRHEMNLDAIASGFSDDFDMVNPAGPYVKGKPDLREAFKTFLRNARKIETIDRIRFIRPDVALVDGSYEFTATELKPYPKRCSNLGVDIREQPLADDGAPDDDPSGVSGYATAEALTGLPLNLVLWPRTRSILRFGRSV